MIRIVVNDVAASPTSGGIYTVLQNFYQEILSSNNDEISWVFLLSGPYIRETENIKVIQLPELKKSWGKRLLFELFTGGKFINSIGPDLYLTLQNTSTRNVRCKQVVYLQQTLQYFRDRYLFSFMRKSERKMAVYQRLIGKLINILLKCNKPHIIVQTKWLKEKLMADGIAESGKIHVLNPRIYPHLIESNFSTDSSAFTNFFYPAAPYPYKMHSIILQAVNNLLIEGITNFNVIFTCNVSDLTTEIDIPKSVSFVGKLSEDEVWKRYRESVLLFPSIIESYGLPLVEAAYCGTKIICANIQPYPEVLDGYQRVSFFNIDSVQELTNLMRNEIIGRGNLTKGVGESGWRSESGSSIINLVTTLSGHDEKWRRI
ncbi:glycosyltransferase [Lacticaseibacillus paracasei]|uniref:glycosyltransferase n=1 Tax=Lacticaseibacillus paracasei TaxID=1597 RepID=UPI000FF20082|nr:glycosyltransferase [Lacticaseibacillus paracasei]RND58140.1 Glycosyl transferases group 1 [Lacticaseibacillus paracasei]